MSATEAVDRPAPAPPVVVNIPQQAPRTDQPSTPRRSTSRPAWLTEPPTIIAALLVLLVLELVAYEAIGPWWLLAANIVIAVAAFAATVIWRRGGGKGGLLDWIFGGRAGRNATPGGRNGRGRGPATGQPGGRRNGGPLRGLLDRMTPGGRRRRATAASGGRNGNGTPGGGSSGRSAGRSSRWPFRLGHKPTAGHSPSKSARRPWWKSGKGGRSATATPVAPCHVSPDVSSKGKPAAADRKPAATPAPKKPEQEVAKTRAKKPAAAAVAKPADSKPAAPKHALGGKIMFHDDASLFRWGDLLQQIPTALDEQVTSMRSQAEQVSGLSDVLSAFAQQGIDDQPASRVLAAEVESIATRFKGASEKLSGALADIARCQGDAEGLHAQFAAQHETDLARRDGERGPRHVESRADVSRSDDV